MTNYAEFVESLILTEGPNRVWENTLGIIGEVGEVAELFKKARRDGHEIDKDALTKELGDVLFYAHAVLNINNFELSKLYASKFPKFKDFANQGYAEGYTIEENDVAEAWEELVQSMYMMISGTNITLAYVNIVTAIVLFAEYQGIVFMDIVEKNMEKLSSRKERGTLRGSGNDR